MLLLAGKQRRWDFIRSPLRYFRRHGSWVKADGRLRLTNIGGMKPANAEAENVRIVTKDGIYEGVCQLIDASVHVNGDYEKTRRNWDTIEVLVDEPVSSKEDTLKLGIMPGDYVCFEPRTRVTKSGYIKSVSWMISFQQLFYWGYGKYLKEENIQPDRFVYAHLQFMRRRWDMEAVLLYPLVLRKPGQWIWAV